MNFTALSGSVNNILQKDAQNGDITSTMMDKVDDMDSINDDDNYEVVIPTWKELQSIYEKRWLVKKAKFHKELRMNFRSLVERYATGKQEIFVLSVPDRREHLYREAFLELFESGYAPYVGEAEQLAGKRVRRLFITLPHSFD